MPSNLASPPLKTPLVELPEGKLAEPLTLKNFAATISRPWLQWFTSVTSRVESSAPVLTTESLTAQVATIAPTALALGTIAGGLYRISYYLRITTAASVSSSATVSIGFTDGAVSCSVSGAALTTNTVASVQSGVFIVRSDQASAVTYAVVYASAGTPMAFSLDLACEAIG